ncbi:serine/threonine-protein phosphatase 4 regulatory subunit 4-like [Hemitrygon akajei]|uniref:serine/threonine-protein phosphatase 4 regulatory subunit 4-like n=1 Tax=Hemitrygon akajei TaxID=2704970 RepID=UPI003BF9834A
MDLNPENVFAQMGDLQELSFIERPVRRYLKTPEEIERLTVDEELNDIERAVYLLRICDIHLLVQLQESRRETKGNVFEW